MAIEIPDDWPNRTWQENTLSARVETLATDAVSGTAPEVWVPSTWDTTREISSSALPGQVRHKSGLSVGTGSALLKRDGNDFPWKKRAVYELSGQNAEILIAPEGLTQIPTGQFRVAEVNGDLTTLGVEVDLDERISAGRDKIANVRGWNYVEEGNQVINTDPAWWIEALAAQMGYGHGSLIQGQDGFFPILDVPLQGSMVPAWPKNIDFDDSTTTEWGSMDGALALSTLDIDENYINYFNTEELSLPQVFTMTLDIQDGWGGMLWETLATFGLFEVYVQDYVGNDDLRVFIRSMGFSGGTNATTALTYAAVPRNENNPHRVQVEVTFTVSGSTYTSASVRFRTVVGSWSAPLVHSMAANPMRTSVGYNPQIYLWTGVVDPPAKLSHFTVTDSATTSAARDTLLDSNSGPNGRIYLEPLFGDLVSPWLRTDLTVWGAMQEITEAWQGALITDVYGDMKLLNRYSLVGVYTDEIPIDVGLKFEDIPWVMNYADQADRLTVTYRPAKEVIPRVTGGTYPVVWEATETIMALVGENYVTLQPEYLYLMDSAQIQFVRKDFDDGLRHVWDAYRYSNGSGTHIDPATNQIGMNLEQISSSTWQILIDNRTASVFYMVDSSGTPWLKVRSGYYIDQTQEVTIERGVSATDAVNPLHLDLSNYVQTAEDADELANFIWGRVNARSWRADTVSMIPDYRLDLGDVVALTHHRTGIRSNALVTKVNLSGVPGETSQSVDLLLIPPTWEDFDVAWAPTDTSDTWIEFDTLWDTYTWADFDRTPTATTVAEIEEAM